MADYSQDSISLTKIQTDKLYVLEQGLKECVVETVIDQEIWLHFYRKLYFCAQRARRIHHTRRRRRVQSASVRLHLGLHLSLRHRLHLHRRRGRRRLHEGRRLGHSWRRLIIIGGFPVRSGLSGVRRHKADALLPDRRALVTVDDRVRQEGDTVRHDCSTTGEQVKAWVVEKRTHDPVQPAEGEADLPIRASRRHRFDVGIVRAPRREAGEDVCGVACCSNPKDAEETWGDISRRVDAMRLFAQTYYTQFCHNHRGKGALAAIVDDDPTEIC